MLTAAFSLVGAIAVSAQTTPQNPADTTRQHNQKQTNQLQTNDPNVVSTPQNTQTVDPSVQNQTTVTTTDPNQDATKPQEVTKDKKSKKKNK